MYLFPISGRNYAICFLRCCIIAIISLPFVPSHLVAPRISCEDATAVKGIRRKMCVRCEVRAKPAANSLYWITDSNGTTVRDGKSVGNISALNMVRWLQTVGGESSLYSESQIRLNGRWEGMGG